MALYLSCSNTLDCRVYWFGNKDCYNGNCNSPQSGAITNNRLSDMGLNGKQWVKSGRPFVMRTHILVMLRKSRPRLQLQNRRKNTKKVKNKTREINTCKVKDMTSNNKKLKKRIYRLHVRD